MITKITAKGFKGSLRAGAFRAHLFFGPNGAGKSARSQALNLPSMGVL